MPSRPSSPQRGHAARRSTRRQLAVEPLEPRQVMAALVAVGSEIGATSTPLVRLVNGETGAVVAQTLAYEAAFRGGVRVALGNVDGDPGLELITAPGPGRDGEVRVFDVRESGGVTSLVELPAYRTLPFGAAYRSGVDVATGDVDGNGLDDIVAAASRGAGDVRVFLSRPGADPVDDVPHRSFTAFAASFNGGASVAVADLGTFVGGTTTDAANPDGKVELVVGGGPGAAPIVRTYDVSGTPRVLATIRPFTAGQIGGVALSAGRYDGDAIHDVIIAAGRGGSGAVEIYNGRTAARLARFQPFTGLARPNAPAFAAGIDRNGDGRIDGFVGTQGDAGGAAGMVALGQDGSRTGTFSTVAGPLRTAAPQTSSAFTTTASGLQYRTVVAGSGAQPVAGQRITAHYTGWLVNGSKFDSSRDRGTPFSFTLGAGEVIAGWDEAFASMRVGERRTIVIPANLAYGSTARPGIPANSPLVFDAELLGVG
ncbi:MAG: FKBP-type peptidyl-prolyl cis-trans isomerase [Planctomycetaceae bacterium]